MFLNAYENQDEQVLMGFPLAQPQLVPTLGVPALGVSFQTDFCWCGLLQ